MATYWENSCSFGLIVSLGFSHLGFWSGNLFLIAPFPDLCLLVPFFLSIRTIQTKCKAYCLECAADNEPTIAIYKKMSILSTINVDQNLKLMQSKNVKTSG